MKSKIYIFCALFLVVFFSFAYSDQTINIMGVSVPVIEGARPFKEEPPSNPGIHVTSYVILKPLNDVVSYYRDFLNENNFLIIGGEERDGFSAAVRKGESMFTIEIFLEANKTMLKFVW